MNDMRYFRFDWEATGFGPGSIWNEFCGETPVRQVECYGGKWFSSREDFHAGLGPGLSEGPLSGMDYGPENEITPEEFERAWLVAGTASDHSG